MAKTQSEQVRPPKCEGKGPYEAMVLSCIDPRIIDQVHYYMNVTLNLRCKYSQFTIAGAAIGVIAPRFRTWHETFWENLSSTVSLHDIKKLYAIDHRDCGACKIAYGDRSIDGRARETLTHRRVLEAFRNQVHFRQPDLEVVLALMDLNGEIEIFT